MKLVYKLSNEKMTLLQDIGLLLGRVGLGFFIAFGHGLGKLQYYSAFSAKFPDPLGVGNELSMALAIFAELFCGILLMLGLFSRIALSQLVITMAVAAFIVHGKDPLFAPPGKASMEFALVYFIGFIMLIFTGPGRFSLDQLLVNKFADNKQNPEIDSNLEA